MDRFRFIKLTSGLLGCVPLSNATKFSSKIEWKMDVEYNDKVTTPRLYKGTLSILKKVYGTFIDMSGWNKGQVWVNGQLLGDIGPVMDLKKLCIYQLRTLKWAKIQ